MTTASAIPAFERPIGTTRRIKRPVSRLIDDEDDANGGKSVAASPGKVTRTVAEELTKGGIAATDTPPTEGRGKPPSKAIAPAVETPAPTPSALPPPEAAPAAVSVSPEALAAAAALQAQGLTGQGVKVLDVAAAIDASYGRSTCTPVAQSQAPNIPQVRMTVRKTAGEQPPASAEAAAARVAESIQAGVASSLTGESLLRSGEAMPPPVPTNLRALTENLNRWRPC